MSEILEKGTDRQRESPVRGIDSWQPAGLVRPNAQFPVAHADRPWLRVVTAGGERRVFEDRANLRVEERRNGVARWLPSPKVGHGEIDPGEPAALAPCVAGSGRCTDTAQRQQRLSTVHICPRCFWRSLPEVSGNIVGCPRISWPVEQFLSGPIFH